MNADPVQLNSAIEAQILQMQIMADQYTKLQKSCELWVLYHMLTSHAEIATFLKIQNRDYYKDPRKYTWPL